MPFEHQLVSQGGSGSSVDLEPVEVESPELGVRISYRKPGEDRTVYAGV